MVAVLNRGKTTAEAVKTGAEAASIEATAEGSRFEQSMRLMEGVLASLQGDVEYQRTRREDDRKEFFGEVAVWRERSAKCDAELAHEVGAARQRDGVITGLKSELAVAMAGLARLSKRAEEEDRRARDVAAASTASDLLRQAGGQVERRKAPDAGLRESVDALHAEVAEIKQEVVTANGRTIGALADLAETRRIEAVPEGERTAAEQDHVAAIPDPSPPQDP